MIFIFAIGFAGVMLDQVFKPLCLFLFVISKKGKNIHILKSPFESDEFDNVQQFLSISLQVKHKEGC
jgi:hypothetical protein